MKTLHYLVTLKVADDVTPPQASRRIREQVLSNADLHFGAERVAVKRVFLHQPEGFYSLTPKGTQP